MNSKQVAIVGAGQSGLVALRQLLRRNIPAECLDSKLQVGGMWNYDGESVSYDALHLNTSKFRSCFSEMGMPKHFGTFPHRSQMQKYLSEFSQQFGLANSIRFGIRVSHAVTSDGGNWSLYDENRRLIGQYANLIVACGHTHEPAPIPNCSDFLGHAIHSSEYRSPERFRDKRVLVVGMGASAVDIAADLCGVSQKVVVSVRTPAHLVPKMVLGRPADCWPSRFTSLLPRNVREWLFSCLVRLSRGTAKSAGLPAPAHGFLDRQPIIASDFIDLVRRGAIDLLGAFSSVGEKVVTFECGHQEEFDVIIFATGYRMTTPFSIDGERDLELAKNVLYQHTISTQYNNLFFIGYFVAIGPAAPLAEAQAEWIAEIIASSNGFPARSAREYRESFASEQLPKSHFLVEYYPFLNAIRAEERLSRRNR